MLLPILKAVNEKIKHFTFKQEWVILWSWWSGPAVRGMINGFVCLLSHTERLSSLAALQLLTFNLPLTSDPPLLFPRPTEALWQWCLSISGLWIDCRFCSTRTHSFSLVQFVLMTQRFFTPPAWDSYLEEITRQCPLIRVYVFKAYTKFFIQLFPQ